MLQRFKETILLSGLAAYSRTTYQELAENVFTASNLSTTALSSTSVGKGSIATIKDKIIVVSWCVLAKFIVASSWVLQRNIKYS